LKVETGTKHKNAVIPSHWEAVFLRMLCSSNCIHQMLSEISYQGRLDDQNV